MTSLTFPPRSTYPDDRLQPANPSNVTIVIPVLNDWEAALLLIRQIDETAVHWQGELHVLVVDDGSTQKPDATWETFSPQKLRSVSVLTLRHNLGHQRAIAVGLAHAQRRGSAGVVVVMDGDGEDDPRDILRLVTASQAHAAIAFAERTHRSEGWRFQAGYRCYQMLYRLATGKSMRVGNFSAMPAACLDRLVISPDLWNHYAAAVARSRLPVTLVPTRRGRRIHGHPRMNMVGLVVHGLSSLAVFADVVGVRMLAATSAIAALGVLITAASLLPGPLRFERLTLVAGMLTLLALQAAVLQASMMVVLLGRRSSMPVSPLHHAEQYVSWHRTIVGEPCAAWEHSRRAAAA